MIDTPDTSGTDRDEDLAAADAFSEALEAAQPSWKAAQPEERILLALGFHAGWHARKPRTITTLEELDALPVGSVIVDRDGDAWQRYSTGWTCTDRAMNTVDQPSASLVNILGPAVVLWEAAA